MNFNANSEINLISLIILAIIFFGNKRAIYHRDRKHFFAVMVVASMLVSFFDMLAAMIRGMSFYGVDVMLYIFNGVSLASMTFVGFLWVLYSYTVLSNKAPSLRFKIITAIPAAIMAIIIFLAPVNGWIFTINSEHLYKRGKFIWIHWLITYPYLVVPTIAAMFKAVKEPGRSRDTLAIILFVLAPLFSSILQSLFYGITGVSVGIAIACMIIYLMVQNQQIHIDALTNVYNRVGLNRRLDELFKGKNRSIYAIMIDIDSFDSINDRYGRHKGDSFLLAVATALKKASVGVEEEVLVTRYSGDEFVVLGIDSKHDAAYEMERLIKSELNAINESKALPEKINISAGIVEGILSDFENADELLVRAEKNMLIEKENHNKLNKYTASVTIKGNEKNSKKEKHVNGAHRLDVKPNEVNRSVLILWLIIVTVLVFTYLIEVFKRARTVGYYSIFLSVTVIPWIVCHIVYLKKPSSVALRYFAPFGYLIMYVFVLFTGSTNLVFSYVLVFMALLVLYHQPSLVLGYGVIAVLANLIFILFEYRDGVITADNAKDYEIQIALLSLCFIGGYVATKLYGRVTRANQVYIEDLHQSNEDVRNVAIESIITIANTIDAKDEYTRGHSQRVAIYSKMLAEKLGLSEEEVVNIYSIGLLHDIGKIGVPDNILNKPARLTDEEYKILQNHTVVGANILKDFDSIQGIDIGTKYHHERYDGRGYPEGLKGDDIPMLARIIAVADSFDAMTSDRVYRKKLTKEQVLSELEKGLGSQFDPQVGKLMIELYNEDLVPVSSKNEE